MARDFTVAGASGSTAFDADGALIGGLAGYLAVFGQGWQWL